MSRRRTLFLTNPCCYYCGYAIEFYSHSTVDHKVPKSRGGYRTPENTVLCCLDCNQLKSDMTEEEFREFKRTGVRPVTPSVLHDLMRQQPGIVSIQAPESAVPPAVVRTGVRRKPNPLFRQPRDAPWHSWPD